jgi:hypothetical protein
MIWTTITTQGHLAEFFWEAGGHSISTALFAALLLRQMATAEPMQQGQWHDTRLEMLEQAKKFEDRAVRDTPHLLPGTLVPQVFVLVEAAACSITQ